MKLEFSNFFEGFIIKDVYEPDTGSYGHGEVYFIFHLKC